MMIRILSFVIVAFIAYCGGNYINKSSFLGKYTNFVTPLFSGVMIASFLWFVTDTDIPELLISTIGFIVIVFLICQEYKNHNESSK